jgi:hypothetical protein
MGAGGVDFLDDIRDGVGHARNLVQATLGDQLTQRKI